MIKIYFKLLALLALCLAIITPAICGIVYLFDNAPEELVRWGYESELNGLILSGVATIITAAYVFAVICMFIYVEARLKIEIL